MNSEFKTFRTQSLECVKNWIESGQKISVRMDDHFGALSKIIIWACNPETQEKICLNGDQTWGAYHDGIRFGSSIIEHLHEDCSTFRVITEQERNFKTLIPPMVLESW